MCSVPTTLRGHVDRAVILQKDVVDRLGPVTRESGVSGIIKFLEPHHGKVGWNNVYETLEISSSGNDRNKADSDCVIIIPKQNITSNNICDTHTWTGLIIVLLPMNIPMLRWREISCRILIEDEGDDGRCPRQGPG
jgi:hypothetical protein